MSIIDVGGLAGRWLALPGNVRGAAWMILSGLGFTAMAVLIKLLGGRLDSLQIAFFRCLIGFLAILPLVLAQGTAAMRTRHFPVHLTRGLFGVLAMICSYYAIQHLPLASYTALSFSKPLFATVLAVLLLREIVRWRRWSATVLGFLGVLVMVRPGAATFDPAALVALGDSLSIAVLIVLIKRLPASETALTMLFHFGIVSSLAALPLAIAVWRAPTAAEYGLLAAIGVLGVLAQTCWIRAFRAGEASAVAPFDYTRLLFAAAFGFVLFAETPDAWAIAGAAVIVASTVYIARREAQLARAR